MSQCSHLISATPTTHLYCWSEMTSLHRFLLRIGECKAAIVGPLLNNASFLASLNQHSLGTNMQQKRELITFILGSMMQTFTKTAASARKSIFFFF